MFVGVKLYESFLCRCLVLYNMINNFTGHETLHYTLCACTPCTLHWRSVLCLYDIHSPVILNLSLAFIIQRRCHSFALSFIGIIIYWHYQSWAILHTVPLFLSRTCCLYALHVFCTKKLYLKAVYITDSILRKVIFFLVFSVLTFLLYSFPVKKYKVRKYG